MSLHILGASFSLSTVFVTFFCMTVCIRFVFPCCLLFHCMNISEYVCLLWRKVHRVVSSMGPHPDATGTCGLVSCPRHSHLIFLKIKSLVTDVCQPHLLCSSPASGWGLLSVLQMRETRKPGTEV